jgi:hypothetical protein
MNSQHQGYEQKETPLLARKRLLIAESDLNRALLTREYRNLAGGIRDAAKPIKQWSALAASGAAVVLLFKTLQNRASATGAPKSSWLSTSLDMAHMALPVWLNLRKNKAPSNSRDQSCTTQNAR